MRSLACLKNFVWSSRIGALHNLNPHFDGITNHCDPRVHSSPSWRQWMSEKYAERRVPGEESNITIAEARAKLFRTELDSLYEKYPNLNSKERAN
jgi:hypothetical protein